MSQFHERYMMRCLQLAGLGRGNVMPNPLVGAVLVHDDRILAEGWHQAYGGPHAEVNCLLSVQDIDRSKLSESVLYVSLEPCSHHGKTPPCTDQILAAGIRKVVIACRDPFPLVNGKGLEKLRGAGVEVTTGCLATEAGFQNRRFFTFHQFQRPYIILKWAQSADGHLATADRQAVRISHPLSDRLVHRWRSEEMAILAGAGTIRHDNPYLTNRLWPGKSPARVLVDPELSLSSNLHVFTEPGQVFILNRKKEGNDGNLHWLRYQEGKDIVASWLESMYLAGLQSIIVEGGKQVLESFLQAGAFDEIRMLRSGAVRIPGGLRAPELPEVRHMHCFELMDDQIDFFLHPDHSFASGFRTELI